MSKNGADLELPTCTNCALSKIHVHVSLYVFPDIYLPGRKVIINVLVMINVHVYIK